MDTNTTHATPLAKIRYAFIKGGIALVPGGSVFSELFGQWCAGPAEAARETYLAELFNDLHDLASRVVDLEVAIEDLPEHPIFREALRRGVEAAMVTDDEEVLAAFRRATINLAEHPMADQDRRRRFLGYLPDLTWQHVSYLRLASTHAKRVGDVRNDDHAAEIAGELMPWTIGRPEELRMVMREVYQLGLIPDAYLRRALATLATPEAVTDLGRAFCEFIGI